MNLNGRRGMKMIPIKTKDKNWKTHERISQLNWVYGRRHADAHKYVLVKFNNIDFNQRLLNFD